MTALVDGVPVEPVAIPQHKGLIPGMRCNVIKCRSGKIRRKAVSAFDGECLILVDLASDALGSLLLTSELLQGRGSSLLELALFKRTDDSRAGTTDRLPCHLHSDSDGVLKATHGTKEVDCKRRAGDVAQLREAVDLGDLDGIGFVPGTRNPVDPLTKERSAKTAVTEELLKEALYDGILRL